jgi:hypothetical protein
MDESGLFSTAQILLGAQLPSSDSVLAPTVRDLATSERQSTVAVDMIRVAADIRRIRATDSRLEAPRAAVHD